MLNIGRANTTKMHADAMSRIRCDQVSVVSSTFLNAAVNLAEAQQEDPNISQLIGWKWHKANLDKVDRTCSGIDSQLLIICWFADGNLPTNRNQRCKLCCQLSTGMKYCTNFTTARLVGTWVWQKRLPKCNRDIIGQGGWMM